jgi:hypothetical protein
MKTVQELLAEARRCAKNGTASDPGTHDAVLWLCDAIEQMQPTPCGAKCERDLDEDNPCFRKGIAAGRVLERERIACMFDDMAPGVGWTCRDAARRIRESAP